jgi:hypothetical protein
MVLAAAIWLDELPEKASFASPKSRILAWPRLSGIERIGYLHGKIEQNLGLQRLSGNTIF